MNQQERFERKTTIINIVISIVSAALVLWTLFEMRADRNASYMPDVSFSDVEVAIQWGDGQREDLTIKTSISIPDFFHEHYEVNTIPELMMHNIGLGTAKDIVVKWNYEANIDALIEYLGIYDDLHIVLEDTMLTIETNDQPAIIGISAKNTTEFLLNTTEDDHALLFPLEYYYLIREALSRSPIIADFPPLTLDVTYTDIQNKMYTKHVSVAIENKYYSNDDLGNGFCLYNLHFTEEENMPIRGSIIIDGDSIAAWSSVIAIIVSIISIFFTTYFSIKQNEHNRNSVLPIASIKFDDYEDRIAVIIENVGTGPLLITSLRLMQGNLESKTLISLMPDINQTWSTYVEEVDGRTIPVGGSITLVEIKPINDDIKYLVRKALCDITASIDYTDIYSTKFSKTRSFEFFGRHYN